MGDHAVTWHVFLLLQDCCRQQTIALIDPQLVKWRFTVSLPLEPTRKFWNQRSRDGEANVLTFLMRTPLLDDIIMMLATGVAASTFRDRTVFIEDSGFGFVSSTRMFGVSTSFGAKMPEGLCYIPGEVSL